MKYKRKQCDFILVLFLVNLCHVDFNEIKNEQNAQILLLRQNQ